MKIDKNVQKVNVAMTSTFSLGSLMRVQYPKCAYGPYRWFNLIQNGVYILVEVFI